MFKSSVAGITSLSLVSLAVNVLLRNRIAYEKRLCWSLYGYTEVNVELSQSRHENPGDDKTLYTWPVFGNILSLETDLSSVITWAAIVSFPRLRLPVALRCFEN